MRSISMRIPGTKVIVIMAMSTVVLVISIVWAMAGSANPNAPSGNYHQDLSEGVIAFNSGDYLLSKTLFTNALTLARSQPASAQALCLFDLSLANAGLGATTVAISELKQATTLYAQFPAPWLSLAKLEIGVDDAESLNAVHHYEVLNPTDVDGKFVNGVLLARTGKTSEGWADINYAVAKNPALKAQIPSGLPH